MPVTIFQLAAYRLGQDEPESLNGRDFEDAGLAILGGCEICGATLAAYNACPSKTGYWRCLNGCIMDDGWDSVEDANAEIFGSN